MVKEKKINKLIPTKIIKRGYALHEEYKIMIDSGKLNKLDMKDPDGGTEGIWVYPLEDDTKYGEKFHFVFFNDPIMLIGSPRAIAGLVGIATSTGKDARATADFKPCVELFRKSGQESIDYHNSIIKKEKAKRAS